MFLRFYVQNVVKCTLLTSTVCFNGNSFNCAQLSLGNLGFPAGSAHMPAAGYQAPEIIIQKLTSPHSSYQNQYDKQTTSEDLKENIESGNSQNEFYKTTSYQIKSVSLYSG